MRQETNNEMDLLLRRLGRQDTPAPSDHLDADELSSYAENVLPPAARARYTEHLAECVNCRDLVVQLSSSAGVVVAQETAKVSEPSTLRKFLASLFSPMVLRYAVPALGLVVVAAIGFMVSRNERPANSPIAEFRDQQPAQAPVTTSQAQPSSSPEKISPGRVNDTAANKADVRAADTAAETGVAALPPNTAPAPASVDTEARDTATKTVEQEQAKTEQAAAPVVKATPAIEESKKLELQKRPAEVRAVVTANEPPAEKAKEQDRSLTDLAAPGPGVARRRGESSGARPMAQREDVADKDKNDAGIRTVAGRRFRKQDNVWIDTAYSSQNLTSLKRGSEQYRGLIADEPAIKQIADQLDGEIIVVWKTRAYRIH